MTGAVESSRLEVSARGRFPLVELELGLVDPPAERLRFGYSEEKLRELMDSIPSRGLLSPAGVRANGGRYLVVWGDHRTEALRRLGWRTAQFFLVVATDDEAVILSAHENLRRKDMSPLEEACLCQRLYEVLGEDTDRVARELCATRDWVESRLIMLRWPDDVLQYVHQGRLNLKQAAALSRIKVDADRAHYIGYSLDGGATADSVASWARDWEMSGAVRDVGSSQAPVGRVAPENCEAVLPCYFHQDREPYSRLVHVWLCPEALGLLVQFRDAYVGGGVPGDGGEAGGPEAPGGGRRRAG